MIHPPTALATSRPAYGAVVALAALVVVTLLPVAGAPGHGARAAAVWTLLMLLPGACLFRLLEPRPQALLELVLAAVVASPLVTTLAAVAVLAGGGDVTSASHAGIAVAAVLGVGAALVRRPALALPRRREAAVLALFIVALLALTATLPLTREWWRIRSDAWFHAAVVAQIRDFGIPPEDPYFAGLPLQYMWFYHVVLATLADALRTDSFWVMALVNAQAVVALVLAGYYFAGTLRTRFAHRFAATATLVLAFNAAFWVLLPVKAVKAFIGDVRGVEELRRTFALTPLDYNRAYEFMNIYFNQEFFLDKFMVATAFGVALVFMTAAWAGAVDYLTTGRRYALGMLAVSIVGMLGFHSLVGFVFLVGVVGGVVLTHLLRARVEGYHARRGVVVIGLSVLCFLAMTPYLYLVMHAKEREQVFPLDFSLRKIVGILISSAFVLFVALRARRFWADRSVGARFLALATAAVTAFCFSIALPGPNTYDKLGYFVFIPLAVVAGIAIADSVAARSGRARVRSAAAYVLLFFLPVNGIAFVACFATPSAVEVTAAEARLSAWVRAHTARDALFIDDHDRVPLLVTGPRRYFWGTTAYADQWGYPRAEMRERLSVVDALYGRGELDAATLARLAAIEPPLYVVLRPEHAESPVARDPNLFERVYEDPEIALLRVDREACARAGEAR